MKTKELRVKYFLIILPLLLFINCHNKKDYKPQTRIVEIIGMKFQPEILEVHKGDTVVWINKDIVAHDVTADDKTWASPTLANGASWEKVITKSDSYYCSIHLTMKGKVEVVE